MKQLIIMGAGGCGREVLQIALNINQLCNRWDNIAFLDYDEHILDNKKCSAKVIGNDDNYSIQENDEFVCAIGNSKIREKTMAKMEQKGAKFINLIHPTAVIADSAVLSTGIIVYPYSIITADTYIGKGCIINMNCTIAHDITIGDFSTISPSCDITGHCTIGKHVFMGVGARIIPSITIGDNAFIGAGSIVMTKVKADRKVLGNPAKVIQGW